MVFLFRGENLNQQRLSFKLENNRAQFSAEGCTVNRNAWFPKFRLTAVSVLYGYATDSYKVNPEVWIDTIKLLN